MSYRPGCVSILRHALLQDEPMHNILDHLGSGGSVPPLVVDAGDENTKSFDLPNPLEF